MGRTAHGISGMKEVMGLLDSLQQLAPIQYVEVLERFALQIKSDYIRPIHSITGALVGSVKIRKRYTEVTKRVSVIAGGAKAPHAHLVEFGHRQITKDGRVVGDVPPKYYLRDAFTKNVKALETELIQVINNLIP